MLFQVECLGGQSIPVLPTSDKMFGLNLAF